MRKTSVYLTEEEVDALRRTAEATGRSQSDIIRQGIRQVIAATGVERTFHSMGIGHGASYEPWQSDELYRKVMGKRS